MLYVNPAVTTKYVLICCHPVERAPQLTSCDATNDHPGFRAHREPLALLTGGPHAVMAAIFDAIRWPPELSKFHLG